MAKKEGKKMAPTPCSRYQHATLREESSGKKHLKGSTDVNSILKMQHLQKIAICAGGEGSIPPLGAFYGQRLASYGEAMGKPLDSSLFLCQRCKTVLQPGYNCTIRIEKNIARTRHCRKSCIPTKNNVIYTCHFCSHRNLKRGTPKGHMKEILASKPKSISISEPINTIDNNSEADLANIEIPTENSPTSPPEKMGIHLSEKKSKSSGPGSNKPVETCNSSAATMGTGKCIGGSSKRKRKAWSTLKEIAENSELDNTLEVSKFTIPFFMTGS